MYNPQIGRWNGADPYDEFASPYLGMGTNPANLVDPSGGSIFEVGSFVYHGFWAVAGAASGALIGGATNGWDYKAIKNGAIMGGAIGLGASFINWGKVGSAIGNFVKNNDFSINFLLYETPEAAARAWGATFNKSSKEDKKEYLSTIFKIRIKKKTYYGFNIPNIGSRFGGSYNKEIPQGSEADSHIHTHGDKGEEEFSFHDPNTLERPGQSYDWDWYREDKAMYLITPSNVLRAWEKGLNTNAPPPPSRILTPDIYDSNQGVKTIPDNSPDKTEIERLNLQPVYRIRYDIFKRKLHKPTKLK